MKNIKILNLSIQDITPYDFGEYTSQYNRWVDFGRDNDYPSYLRNLYITSPTHQAVMEGVINMTTGEGVELVDPANNPISNTFLNRNFPKDVVKKLVSDLKTYGFCILQMYSQGSIVKYDDAIKYRFAPKNKDGMIKTIWFSNNWEEYTQKGNRPVELPLFEQGINDDLSILVYQLDKKGYEYYSPVDYSGSINYISLETEISKYHLSNLKNGLFPSFLINYIGSEFSDEQMDEIERKINQKFGGSTNTGKAILNFSPTKDDAATISVIEQPNISDTYQFLTKECSEKILIGHGVTSPILFGLRDSGGGLGNNSEELEKSFYLFYENKLKHYQNYILEMITKVMRANYLFAEVQFKTYNPFANNEKKQELSKTSKKTTLTELNSIKMLQKIDNLKKTTENVVVLNENIFDGVEKENTQYKFMRSSNNENIIIHKFMILDKQGYVFEYDAEIIKNTKDYYFIEQDIVKKTN
jgi:hypothetical protein